MSISRRAFLGTGLGTGAALALGPALAPTPAQAARLRSVRVEQTASLPLIRPDWPVPKEPHQIFFIQRSTNANTIVYTANFSADGALHPRNPVHAFWRRYASTGERMALRPIERRFAFGVRARRDPKAGGWIVHAAAAPMFPVRLRQSGPFAFEATGMVGGRPVRPAYGFVSVDEGRFLPRVTGFSLHGTDPATGHAICEYFAVSGGTFSEQ